MKTIATAAMLSTVLATAAVAAPQTNTSTTAPAATATAAAKFTIDTPIEVLVADPQAAAVVASVFPTLTKNPYYEQFKAMSFKDVQPMSNGKITDEQVAKVAAGLAALK